MENGNGKLAFTIEEAAKELTISLSMAYKLVREGKLKVVRAGDRLIVPRTSIDSFLSGEAPACPAAK